MYTLTCSSTLVHIVVVHVQSQTSPQILRSCTITTTSHTLLKKGREFIQWYVFEGACGSSSIDQAVVPPAHPV